MRLLLLFIILFLCHFCRQSIYAWEAPLEISSWETRENAQFDDPSIPCLQRDGPSKWEQRTQGIGILIDQSLPCQTVITPKDPQYFGLRRFSLSFTMKIDDAAHDHNILVLWKDRNNFADFHLFGQGIEYEKIVNGKPVYSVSARLAVGPGSVHSYRVEHDESTGVTRLWRDGIAIFSAIEPKNTPELPDSWVGYRASVGEQRTSDVTFSSFVVENLGQRFTTTAQILKQNDARWKNEEYDHAENWSPTQPTIARWGCALTSGIMVMRSYGIDHFPDGTPLLPNTLNDWLLTQDDGYFGEGHLNWRALTRLALQIHDVFGTTKLEFSYALPKEKLTWLTEVLKEGKPAILDLNGHFIVGYEAGEGENDFLIHDPLYPFTKLKSYDNDFLSARLFTPSQTDLSALTIIAPLNVSLTFLDLAGNEQSATKLLLPPLEQNSHDAVQLFDLPKPPHGEIQLRLQTTQAMNIPLTLFSYSQKGAVQKEELIVPKDTQAEISIHLHWSAEDNRLLIPEQSSILAQTHHHFVSSPFFPSQLLHWKSLLQSMNTLEECQKLLTSILWSIDKSWKYSWLSSGERQLLLFELERTILEKFP